MRVGLKADNPVDRIAMAAGRVPAPVFEAYFAVGMARAIMAGASLGIFAALAEQPDDAAGLARRLDLQEPGVDVLLVALHTLGYLHGDADGRYRNARQTKRWLLPGDKSVEQWTGEFGYDMWEAFGELETVLRGGEPQSIHAKEADDAYWSRYMRGLFQVSRLAAPRYAKLLGLGDPRSGLDLAGGHGAYAIALCERHTALRMTIVDLEGAARHGREIVAGAGFADRVGFLVGDMFDADLGTGHDVVLTNNILHHLDAEGSVRLLRRAREALKRGGTMAIGELERPSAGERGSQVGALTGLLFHVSSGAKTWTAAEMESFLAEAGYAKVRTRRHPELPGSAVVIGLA